MNVINNNASFIWSIADLLRGDFKQSEYARIILPFTILRRLDCLLEDTKQAVLDQAANMHKDTDDEVRMYLLCETANAGGSIYNDSRFTFNVLKHENAECLHINLVDYLLGFSPDIHDILVEKFKLVDIIRDLDEKGSLKGVFDLFGQIDLHPDKITNLEMGYLFEELIRRFSEMSNETAGEHFTPREVVRLLVDLLFVNDREVLTGKGIIRRVYDPACGTGGMLTVAEESMKMLNNELSVELFGQELNGESYAVCKSDMMIKGHDASLIAYGNTLTDDAHAGETFHYMLSNPPYGVDWKKYAEPIRDEAKKLGDRGRFGAGLPATSDGQFLFVQHMVSKMRDDEKGARIGIVMNGSPLFSGGAASGYSEIRRWLMEQDLVEVIIALPTDIFYNTGIQTYIWILSNRKLAYRCDKVQLIDASDGRFWSSMRKSLGSKRREISDEARGDIVRIYGECMNGGSGHEDVSRIFDTTDFGYREIRVERPLRLRLEITRELLDELRDNEKSMTTLETAGKNIDFTNILLAELAKRQDKSWIDHEAFSTDLTGIMAKHGNNSTDVMLELLIGCFGISDGTVKITKDLLDQLHADKEFMSVLKQSCQNSGNFTDMLFELLEDRLGKVWMDRTAFIADLAEAMTASRIKLSTTGIKLLVNHFGEADEDAEICRDRNGAPEPNPKLRDHEIVPLLENWQTYIKREVLPFVPDAWVDESHIDVKDGKVGRVGYEINFNRYFYKYVPPRPLEEINAELYALEDEISGLLKGMRA